MGATLRPAQNQNLVRQIAVDVVAKPAGYYKSLVLDALIVLSAFAVGLSYRFFLAREINGLVVGGAIVVFGICAVFEVLLFRSWGRRLIVALLEILALMAPFYDRPLRTLFGLAVALFAFRIWGDLVSYRELALGLEIRFFRVIRPLVGKIMSGLIIAGLVLYLPQWQAKETFLAESDFDVIFTWAAGTAKNFYPELNFNSSVFDFSQSLAVSQLKGNPTFNKLVPAGKERLIAETTKSVIESLRKTFGIEVSAEQSLSRFLYFWFMTTMGEWAAKFGDQFLFVWAVAAFAILRSLSIVYYGVIGVLAFGLYHLLIALNVIGIVGETQTKEVIQYVSL